VPDRHVVLLDARDLDPADERAALEASDVRRVAADARMVAAALHDLPAGPVYLHVDVDIVDGGDLPRLRFYRELYDNSPLRRPPRAPAPHGRRLA
jgi:arginase